MAALHAVALVCGLGSLVCALADRHPGAGWGRVSAVVMFAAMLDGLVSAIVPTVAWSVSLGALALAAAVAARVGSREGVDGLRTPLAALVMGFLVLAADPGADEGAESGHHGSGGSLTLVIVAAVVVQLVICVSTLRATPSGSRVALARGEVIGMTGSVVAMSCAILATSLA